ncbi:putative membrane protein [Streptomyces davaonensis JCM 4913]|uniref:Putative membrane protein n=1 Tax=Streptomyces davaonensis (strain DSM 101723 / JCM 4913 / KCC S-0913 / 768) TaxID=1214101 RepID=K4RCK1_STRDJ|nr:hypothetical protein [Streptomyces davaonensis]CCK30604.1 putative membrane protein [Streptomyces davaonensis JCM 4913]
MGTIVLTGTVVLVIMGFGNSLYWLAAVAVLYLYVKYGRNASPTPPSGGSGPAPSDYRAYRDRRDLQAKWERRYQRERGGRNR